MRVHFFVVVCACVYVCMYKLCVYIFVWLCVRVRVYAGIKMYRREVSNICLTKKENGRNCVIVEISPRLF